VWSYSAATERGNASLPYVDPGSSSMTAMRPGGGPEGTTNVALIEYLQANRGDAKWLAATESSMSASGIIIATGEPVMAMGGFSGSDPAVTVQSIADMVDDGTLRFFLLGGRGGPPGAAARPDAAARPGATIPAGVPPIAIDGPRAGARGVTTALTEACKPVDAALYGGSTGSGGGPGGASQLYDCQGAGEAIRAAGGAS
jgi:hypothetical protein